MILHVLGQQMQIGRRMIILSHIHGLLAWRRSGYWMILHVLGEQMQIGRSVIDSVPYPWSTGVEEEWILDDSSCS
jgi:hypothetical protein